MARQTHKTLNALEFRDSNAWLVFYGLVAGPSLKINHGNAGSPVLTLNQAKNVHAWLGKWITRQEKGGA